MNKYICVENQGLIQVDDLKLIGSSSKRGVDGKIGMFGSGWKYALAWLIRNDASPVIYSGTKKIVVDFNYKLHRDNPVRVITFDGEESSLTAEMGPTWQGWMAFREIFSNAIDEGGHSVKLDVNEEDIRGIEGISRVYIPVTDGMNDVINNFNTYFSFNMRPVYTCSLGKIFTYPEEKNVHHFRKGIRCYNSTHQKSKIAIDFETIEIDEDRLAKHWDLSKAITKFIAACDDIKGIELLICNTEASSHPDVASEKMVEAFRVMNARGIKFSTTEMSRLLPTHFDTVIIGSKLLQDLVEKEVIDHPMSKWIKNGLGFLFVGDEIYDEMARNVEYYLSECLTNFTVQIGTMSDDTKYKMEHDPINGIPKSYQFFISKKFVTATSSTYNSSTEEHTPIDNSLVAKRLAAKCLLDMEDIDIIAELFN